MSKSLSARKSKDLSTVQKPPYYDNVTRSLETCVSSVRQSILKNESTDNAIHGKTQSGKTEGMIYVMDNMIQHCKSVGKDYRFLYLLCMPSNSLREQSTERLIPNHLEHAKRPSLRHVEQDYITLDSRVKTEHARAFDEGKRRELVEFLNEGDVSAVFFDESHYGISEGQNIHGFLEQAGLNPVDHPSNWSVDEDKSVHMFWVSATGYTRMLLDAQNNPIENDKFSVDQSRFGHYYLQSGNGHVDAGDMLEHDKIKNITREERNDHSWFYERYLECKTDDQQHMLVRLSGDENVIPFKRFFEDRGVNVIEFSSHDFARDISELQKDRTYKLHKSTIFLVRGGLRMGITIPHEGKGNIKYAIDTHSRFADTVAQSFVGRMTGYPLGDINKDEWIEYLPVVYCNKGALEDHIKYEEAIENEEVIDPPRNSKMKVSSSRRIYEWKVIANVSDIENKTTKEIKDYIEDSVDFIDEVGWATSISKNNKNDAARAINENRKPQGFQRMGISDDTDYNVSDNGIVVLDGPSKNYIDSWNKMVSGEYQKGDILWPSDVQVTEETKEDGKSMYADNG